jgi:hypothetical protein
MIYDELYRYFILHKQLNIPGIGHFQLQRSPASGDFNNKRVDPPLFTIVLSQEISPSGKNIQLACRSIKHFRKRCCSTVQ